MKKIIKYIEIIFIFALLFGCYSEKQKAKIDQGKKAANNFFADNSFKRTINLIEVHKLRFYEYPERLEDIKYATFFASNDYKWVEYNKLSNGYELNLIIPNSSNKVPSDSLSIKYPDEFWQGLGIIKSNMKVD